MSANEILPAASQKSTGDGSESFESYHNNPVHANLNVGEKFQEVSITTPCTASTRTMSTYASTPNSGIQSTDNSDDPMEIVNHPKSPPQIKKHGRVEFSKHSKSPQSQSPLPKKGKTKQDTQKTNEQKDKDVIMEVANGTQQSESPDNKKSQNDNDGFLTVIGGSPQRCKYTLRSSNSVSDKNPYQVLESTEGVGKTNKKK